MNSPSAEGTSERIASLEGALRALIDAWTNPGSMGVMYEMPRAANYAEIILQRQGGSAMPQPRSNENAADEIAAEMRRRWGYDMRHAEPLKWLARCIGEVRAEVVEPNMPPHSVIGRWSREAGK